MKTGVELIAEERQEQIEKHGYDLTHDIHENIEEDLALAGALYALPFYERDNDYSFVGVPKLWPFAKEYWKPTPENRVKELQKAGALIAAEIDRLQNL